jgi:hypothetical protein
MFHSAIAVLLMEDLFANVAPNLRLMSQLGIKTKLYEPVYQIIQAIVSIVWY